MITCLQMDKCSSPLHRQNIDDCVGHTCGAYGVCVGGLENYTCNCQKDSSRELMAAEKSVETSMIAMVFHAVQQVRASMRLDLLYVSAALATAMT